MKTIFKISTANGTMILLQADSSRQAMAWIALHLGLSMAKLDGEATMDDVAYFRGIGLQIIKVAPNVEKQVEALYPAGVE